MNLILYLIFYLISIIDNEANVPYCYCNEGFYGPACDNLGNYQSKQSKCLLNIYVSI